MNYLEWASRAGAQVGGTILRREDKSKVVDWTEQLMQRRLLREGVVDIPREMVLNGRLKPGERVLELDLCGKLNVRRTPMREALASDPLLSFLAAAVRW